MKSDFVSPPSVLQSDDAFEVIFDDDTLIETLIDVRKAYKRLIVCLICKRHVFYIT